MFLLCTCGPLVRSENLFQKWIQGKGVQSLSGCTWGTVGIAHHVAFLTLVSRDSTEGPKPMRTQAHRCHEPW